MSQPDRRDESLAAQLLAALPLGVPTPGRGRTITAGEIALLAGVSEWPTQAKTVEEVVRESEPLELEPHLVLPVMLSLAAANPLFHRLEQDHGLVTVAALSHRAELKGAVRANDTMITETEIQSVRASSSKPGHYVVTVKDVGMDQHRNEIVVIERVLLMRHEPEMKPDLETAG
jgi:acyl dehydratase